MVGIPVRTLDVEGLREWREDPEGLNRAVFAKRKIEETGETVLCWLEDPPGRFSWVCPGCGGLSGGQLGDEAVSGWEEPRWVNSGTRERPTLTPSLGCPGWRNGFCSGHYWLRDGELIQA